MVSTLERRTSSTPLGQVLRLPCKFIQGTSTSTTPPMIINTIAKELAITGRNILPVMVKNIKQDKYTSVFNTKILVAAKQAGLDFVYCIVIDEEMADQLKVEVGQTIRVNLNLSSESELTAAFENIKTNLAALNKIQPATIAQNIVQYRAINHIKDLNFLTKLKCGIGKAKLPLLGDRLSY